MRSFWSDEVRTKEPLLKESAPKISACTGPDSIFGAMFLEGEVFAVSGVSVGVRSSEVLVSVLNMLGNAKYVSGILPPNVSIATMATAPSVIMSVIIIAVLFMYLQYTSKLYFANKKTGCSNPAFAWSRGGQRLLL